MGRCDCGEARVLVFLTMCARWPVDVSTDTRTEPCPHASTHHRIRRVTAPIIHASIHERIALSDTGEYLAMTRGNGVHLFRRQTLLADSGFKKERQLPGIADGARSEQQV